MEIVEVVRRWQVGESQRAITRGGGVARETVKKYLRAAEELGLAAHGPPPNEGQVVQLVYVGGVVGAPRTWATPQADRLEPSRKQITTWLQNERLQLTRVQEFGQRGLHVTYSTPGTLRMAIGLRTTAWPAWRYGAHGRDTTRRGGRDGFRTPGSAPQSGDRPTSVGHATQGPARPPTKPAERLVRVAVQLASRLLPAGQCVVRSTVAHAEGRAGINAVPAERGDRLAALQPAVTSKFNLLELCAPAHSFCAGAAIGACTLAWLDPLMPLRMGLTKLLCL
jgi:hypothetical protein